MNPPIAKSPYAIAISDSDDDKLLVPDQRPDPLPDSVLDGYLTPFFEDKFNDQVRSVTEKVLAVSQLFRQQEKITSLINVQKYIDREDKVKFGDSV